MDQLPCLCYLSQKFIEHVDTIVDTLGAIGLHLHKFGEMLSFSPFSFAFRAFGVLCEVSSLREVEVVSAP